MAKVVGFIGGISGDLQQELERRGHQIIGLASVRREREVGIIVAQEPDPKAVLGIRASHGEETPLLAIKSGGCEERTRLMGMKDGADLCLDPSETPAVITAYLERLLQR